MRFLSSPPVDLRGRSAFPLFVALTASGTLGMHVIVPALPATARALDVSVPAVQLTITLYLIGLAVGQLIYGPLSDRFGRRPVLLAGMSLFAVASFAAAFAPNAPVLVGARILQALGGCSGLVLGRAAVRDSAEPSKAAGQLALLTMTMSAVPAIAPAIGGYVTAFVHWRASYVLVAALGAATLFATWLTMPETNRATTPGSLWRGNAMLLRSPVFLGYAVGGAMSTTSFYAFMAAAPFIFEGALGRPTHEVGIYYLILMVGVAFGSFLANRLSRRVSIRTGALAANGFAVAGAVGFAAADALGALSVLAVVATIGVFMIGAGMTSPFALAGSVSANPRAIGAASGLYGFFQMGYGMLCTVAVELWSPGASHPVAAILLGSALAGMAAIRLGVRRA